MIHNGILYEEFPDILHDSPKIQLDKTFNLIQRLRCIYEYANPEKYEGLQDDDLVKVVYSLANSIRDLVGTYTLECHQKQQAALKKCERAYKRAYKEVEKEWQK